MYWTHTQHDEFIAHCHIIHKGSDVNGLRVNGMI
jgi:hypothetical protein